MKRGFALATLVCSLCLIVVGLVLSPSASGAFKSIQDGMQAPVVTGTDLLTGEKVTSEATAEGEVVVVTFWATWSQRSLELLADLKVMTETYADHPIRVIAVNVESETISSDTEAEIRRQVEEMNLPYPVVIDRDLEIFYEFGVIAVPSTAVLNAEGVLRYGPAGYSYAVRDRMVDSTETLLGIREPETGGGTLAQGHRPDLTSSRYYHLGMAMVRKGMLERALEHVARAVEADSAFSAPHRLRGEILLELEQPEEAADAFATAVRLDDLSVSAWAGWGRAVLVSGDDQTARDHLARAIELDESYVPALVDMARCRCEAGETEPALAMLREARELNPLDLSVSEQLARCYRRAGLNKEAVQVLREALEQAYPGLR